MNLLPPRFHRRINRCVQRLSPAFPRLITHGGDHKQVPRAGCGDVRHARTLRLIAEQFLVFVLKQIGRRASGKADRAHATIGINMAGCDGGSQLRRHVGKDHDREFQAFGFMDRHQPHAVAAFLEDRRFPGFAALGLLAQLVNESAKRNAAFGLIAARQLGDMRNIGEHLLAAVLERKPDVRAGGFEEQRNCRRHRHPIARAMERLQQF